MGVNKRYLLPRAPRRVLPPKYTAENLKIDFSKMETFNRLLFEYPELMYSGVGATAVIAGGALIYKITTRSVITSLRFDLKFQLIEFVLLLSQ